MGAKSATAREASAARTREALLDAAEALFAERGYRGTSLEEIATAAGVSRGLPGYVFGSKEGLYRATLERVVMRQAEALKPGHRALEAPERSPEDGLRAVVDRCLDFDANFVRLIQWESVNGGKCLQSLDAQHDAVADALEALQTRLSRAGAGRVDPRYLLVGVAALCWFPQAQGSTLLRTLGLDPDDPAFKKEYGNYVVELVSKGMGLR